MEATGLCGRPRARGAMCRNRRMFEWFPDRTVVALACGHHLTAEDRATYELALAAARAPFEAAEPACWSWPLPTEPVPSDDHAAWQYLVDWHQDRCALCGRPASIMEDHDHDTGLTRGWLCGSCNLVEGRSRTPILARYRSRPPTVLLGLRLVYNASVWQMPILVTSVITGPDPVSLIDNPS